MTDLSFNLIKEDPHKKYIDQGDYISSRITFLKILYEDRTEYKNVEATYNKTRIDLEKAIIKLVNLIIEYYKETDRSIVTGNIHVYDAKISRLSDTIKNIIINVDDNAVNDDGYAFPKYAGLFTQIADSTINDYLYQKANPPAPAPFAPPVPPLKINIQTDKR
jgi:hypothetical protein